MKTRLALGIATAAIAALTLTACSGGDDAPSADPATQAPAADAADDSGADDGASDDGAELFSKANAVEFDFQKNCRVETL